MVIDGDRWIVDYRPGSRPDRRRPAATVASDGLPDADLLLRLVFSSATRTALAMEPLGHIAGIGAAIVGSLSTFISVPMGTMIGQSYNGTIVPLVAGIAILAGLSLVVVCWIEAG